MDSVILPMQHRLQQMQREGSFTDEIKPLKTKAAWWAAGIGDVAESIAKSADVDANTQNVAVILLFT